MTKTYGVKRKFFDNRFTKTGSKSYAGGEPFWNLTWMVSKATGMSLSV